MTRPVLQVARKASWHVLPCMQLAMHAVVPAQWHMLQTSCLTSLEGLDWACTDVQVT